MKNIEKWYDKLIELGIEKIAVVDNKPAVCCNANCPKCQINKICGNCQVELIKWLNSEYVKPEVDWDKVPIGTKVLVSDDNEEWERAYFRGETQTEFPFRVCTHPVEDSWSTIPEFTQGYKYCKLAEDEENEKH